MRASKGKYVERETKCLLVLGGRLLASKDVVYDFNIFIKWIHTYYL